MKIVRIFGDQLFAFQYKNDALNELERLLELWTDIGYVYEFLKENKNDIGNQSAELLTEQIIEDATEIDDTLNEISSNKNQRLESFFRPLDNKEYQFKILSKQKGRVNYLRIYALKIDDNCFVITGGAIKFTHLMEERNHTKEELLKLENCRNFLQENQVHDSDSFFEFFTEQL